MEQSTHLEDRGGAEDFGGGIGVVGVACEGESRACGSNECNRHWESSVLRREGMGEDVSCGDTH
jgi:hypothetical protein